jgi:hypothetical protein
MVQDPERFEDEDEEDEEDEGEQTAADGPANGHAS